MGAALAITILITSRKEVTDFELGLLQFILFAGGAALTWIFGRRSVKAEAEDLIRRDGQKAIRRIVNLADGVTYFDGILNRESTQLEVMAGDNDGMVPVAAVGAAFDALADHVPGQLRTLDDAIQDWRDIVPEQVADLERRVEEERQRQVTEPGQDQHV